MRCIPYAAPLVLIALTACGARTGLDESARDGGLDPTMDASSDDGAIGRDAEPGVDATIPCPECDDGLFCTGPGRCDAVTRACVPGTPPSCDDGDPCTEDRCDPTLDACVNDRFGELSVCGDCRVGCRRAVIPDETGWDPDGEDATGVEVDETGALRLVSTRRESHFAWIANYRFGTITKIDTRDGSQAAEYDAIRAADAPSAPAPRSNCPTETPGGNCPSRTAVDLDGAVYVANRAFFGQGTITKIAGFESDCIDRNGNGVIDTSRDVNGNGVIEEDVSGEFLGQDDECILWTVPVGETDGVPRALAIDASGRVWVGLHNSGVVLQLDPRDGSVLRTLNLPIGPFGPFRPYGAAADGQGRIWFVEVFTGRIVDVDVMTGRVGTIRTASTRADDCSSSYGIAIDARDRVWIAGLQCRAAFRWDPATSRWFEVPLPDSGATRGIAADADGRIYIASSHEWLNIGPGGIDASDPHARLTVFNGDDGGDLRIFGTPANPLPGLASIGVGLDSTGGVWLINQASSTTTRVFLDGRPPEEHATGVLPYTYSDFTGFALRNFTAPNGAHRWRLEGCERGPTEWERVLWDADVPSGTRVFVRVRAAATPEALAEAPFVTFEGRPTDLLAAPGPLPSDRFLEVEVALASDGARTPVVRSVTVQYHCPAL